MKSLDEKDRKILQALQEDARLSMREISKRTGISFNTVRDRISGLQSRGVIKGYAVMLDPEKLPEQRTMGVVLMRTSTEEDTEEIASRIRDYDEVIGVFIITGEFDILALVRGSSNKDLGDFISRTLRRIPGIIDTNTSMVTHQIKLQTNVSIGDQGRHLPVDPE